MITIPMVISENRMLRPAMAMITTPIDEPNLGFKTLNGAESAGVLYVPSKYIGGDEILKTPEYDVPIETTRPFWKLYRIKFLMHIKDPKVSLFLFLATLFSVGVCLVLLQQ
jgi:hypothetical protein